MNAFSISPLSLINLVSTLLLAALPAGAQTAGALDSAYDPNVSGSVVATAMQPDGKTIILGGFGTVGGVAHPGLARLNVDGTVDGGAPRAQTEASRPWWCNTTVRFCSEAAS